MSNGCVIYGANGFTGRKLIREAAVRGLPLIMAGRSRARLEEERQALVSETGCSPDIRVASLESPAQLDELLRDVAVVLNAAGPYSRTAVPIVESCIRTRTHYLDVTGELPVIERVHHFDAAAHEAGTMLMPAVGYAIVPSDCLALRATRLVENPVRLRIALSHFELFAAGSAKSMIELVRNSVRVRRDGELIELPVGHLERSFDYGDGPSRSTAINWCDAFTAHLTTGIANIEVYLEANALERLLYAISSSSSWWISQPLVQAWLRAGADWWLGGRSTDETLSEALDGRRRCLVVEATDTNGRGVQLRLTSPEPYRVTAECATAIVARVLEGQVSPGFATPAMVYGDELLREISNVRLERRWIQQ